MLPLGVGWERRADRETAPPMKSLWWRVSRGGRAVAALLDQAQEDTPELGGRRWNISPGRWQRGVPRGALRNHLSLQQSPPHAPRGWGQPLPLAEAAIAAPASTRSHKTRRPEPKTSLVPAAYTPWRGCGGDKACASLKAALECAPGLACPPPPCPALRREGHLGCEDLAGAQPPGDAAVPSIGWRGRSGTGRRTRALVRGFRARL